VASRVAVGTFTTSSSVQSISEFWAGRSWLARAVPKPGTSDLNAVSCPSANNCIAVGAIVKNSVQVTLAERWNGVGWTIQRTPNPAGTSRSFLLGVSCEAETACTAVGFSTRNGHQLTLAEHWNGKTWQIQRTPVLRGKASLQFNGVSCTSARACTAVGTYVGGGFAETWDGTSWKLHAVPTPSGGKSPMLYAVSCTSARGCTAVGQYSHGSATIPLAERWNGQKWAAEHVAATGISGSFAGVSCASADACAAVGTKGSKGLAERWNGRTWAALPLQIPPGSLSTGLSSVSCNSAVACMAAGNYTDGSATQITWAQQYS